MRPRSFWPCYYAPLRSRSGSLLNSARRRRGSSSGHVMYHPGPHGRPHAPFASSLQPGTEAARRTRRGAASHRRGQRYAVDGHQPARHKLRKSVHPAAEGHAVRTQVRCAVSPPTSAARSDADAFGAGRIGVPAARASRACTLRAARLLRCCATTAGSAASPGAARLPRRGAGAVRALLHRAVAHGEGCTCSRRPAGLILAPLSLYLGARGREAAPSKAQSHGVGSLPTPGQAPSGACMSSCFALRRHGTDALLRLRCAEPEAAIAMMPSHTLLKDKHVRPGDTAEPAHSCQTPPHLSSSSSQAVTLTVQG
jgi:hypothetical protein